MPPKPNVTTGPPDFVGVGAQRAGTTWWFRTLAVHPQVRPPRKRVKELHYFDRFCLRELRADDVAEYHDLFPRRPGQVVGEWTPIYMSAWWIPRLVRKAAPDTKLLVMLRDPIERYRSGIKHHRERSPERLAETIAVDAIDRGCYATQLERLYSIFPAERILVLQYEKCREDPQTEYSRTLRFLEVEDAEVPEPERPRGSTQAARKDPLWPDMERTLHRVLNPEVARLREVAPEIDVSLWPNFQDLARG